MCVLHGIKRTAIDSDALTPTRRAPNSEMLRK